MDSAPVILARALGDFTQWALGRALAAGVRRLYFLSRDGWYPFRLGEALCRGWDLPIECRYLYGSRRAWRLPLAHRDPARLVGQLCGKGGGATLGDILFQAGLSPREAGAAAASLGLPQELPLSPGQRRELAPRLLVCPAFLHPMEAASRRAVGPFLGYLRQEGLGEDVPWAVVDSGWMGSTQDTLGEALTLLGRPGSPRGYYAGLYRAPRRGQWEGFFFQPGERLAIQAGFEPSLWEAAFAAPHGTVLGYGPRDGGFVPLLGEARSSPAAARLEEAFTQWGEHLARQPRPRDLVSHARRDLPGLWEELRPLMARPTGEQAALLGRLPFSQGPRERPGERLAPRLSQGELAGSCLLPRLLGREAASSWLPGSAARSVPQPEKWFSAFDRLRLARALSFGLREGRER